MALDRVRPDWICGVPLFELAHFRQSVRVSTPSKGAFSHDLLGAVERRCRRISKSSPYSKPGRDRRNSRIALHRARLALFDPELAEAASDLRDVDHRELADSGVCDVHRKHAPLRSDHVPDFLFLRISCRKPLLAIGADLLVTVILCPLQQSLRARLVGLLN